MAASLAGAVVTLFIGLFIGCFAGSALPPPARAFASSSGSRARRRDGGFTLIEVLVAIFVLAVAVAGAAATGLGTLRLRQQAALESQALQLAAALGSRMRVNPARMALPDAANPYLGFDYDAAGGDPPPPAAHCFGGTACNPGQLASFDLHETARVVRTAFPGGRILVCRDGKPWNPALGALAWKCDGDAAAAVVVKIGWRVQPPSGGAPTDAADATPVVVLAVAR